MSSAPAQPSAVRSTNQPAIWTAPDVVTGAPSAGASITPEYVLSPTAPGPANQPTPSTGAASVGVGNNKFSMMSMTASDRPLVEDGCLNVRGVTLPGESPGY